MAYNPPNPFLTNIIPLFNVTTSSAGPAVTTTSGNYLTQINGFSSMLDYNTYTLTANTIQPATGNQTTFSSNVYINGLLYMNGIQFGPDSSNNITMTGNLFSLSTGTTSLLLQDTRNSNVSQGITFTTNNSNVLSFNRSGDATFSGSITCQNVYQLSDERLKNNIASILNPISTISKFNGVHYIMNGASTIGFIAQDIYSILPNIVNTTNNNWSIDYSQIIPLLVESIKELSKKVNALELLQNRK